MIVKLGVPKNILDIILVKRELQQYIFLKQKNL